MTIGLRSYEPVPCVSFVSVYAFYCFIGVVIVEVSVTQPFLKDDQAILYFMGIL